MPKKIGSILPLSPISYKIFKLSIGFIQHISVDMKHFLAKYELWNKAILKYTKKLYHMIRFDDLKSDHIFSWVHRKVIIIFTYKAKVTSNFFLIYI